jgi:hypothetical protein
VKERERAEPLQVGEVLQALVVDLRVREVKLLELLEGSQVLQPLIADLRFAQIEGFELLCTLRDFLSAFAARWEASGKPERGQKPAAWTR